MRETALRLAVEEESRRKTNVNDTHERSIIILGSKGVVSDEVKGSMTLSYFCVCCVSRVRRRWCIDFLKKMKSRNRL